MVHDDLFNQRTVMRPDMNEARSPPGLVDSFSAKFQRLAEKPMHFPRFPVALNSTKAKDNKENSASLTYYLY